MILATIFIFIIEISSKNMYFHPKLAWPPATYDVIYCNHSNPTIIKLVSKCARGMNELKTSSTDILSSREKLRKTLWVGGIHPPLYVRGLSQ